MNLDEKLLEIFNNQHNLKSSEFLRKKSSVLMLSGGVDSVSLLKRILLETDELIYAHHIHLKNGEGEEYPRYKKETESLRKIVPYMKKNFRKFNYTESTINVNQIMQLRPNYYEEEDFPLIDLNFVPDQIYYHFMGGLLAKITLSDKIYIGTCTEDYDVRTHLSQGIQDSYGLPDCPWDHGLAHSSGLHDLKNRQLWTSGIAKGSAWPHEITYHRPHDDISKRQNIEYIGEELMNMVWYCREPMEKNGEFVVCHECKSCVHVDDALSEKE